MKKQIKPDVRGAEEHTMGPADHEVPPEPVKPGDGQAQDATIEGKPVPSRFNSFWSKAKEAVTEVSAQATIAGNSLASKAVTVGTTAAAKTSEIGKQTLSTSAEMTQSAIEVSKQAYAGSRIESTVNYLDSELEQHGVKQTLKETSAAVVGKLDEVTGKRLLDLVEQRLQLQDYYNDVLATRLAEALGRISRLETQLAGVKTAEPATAQDPVTERDAVSTRR